MKKASIPFITLAVCQILLLLVAMPATADTITRFDSGKGYSIWYDSIVVAPIPEDEGSGVDAFQSYPANPYPVDLAIWSAQTLDFSLENAIANAKQSLGDNGVTDINDIDTADLFSPGLKSAGCRGIYDGRLNTMQYVLLAPGGMEYYISLSYPVEAEEHIAKQLRDMLQSFQIAED